MPLASDYEASCDPSDEVLSGHRVYVPKFDITPFVKNGDNVIAVCFGGGWYTYGERIFGLPKVIYRIFSDDDTCCYVSDESCRIGKSFVNGYSFTKFECHDYLACSNCIGTELDDSEWEYAYAVESLDTEYCSTDCPTDALIEELHAKPIGNSERGIVYDCGLNTVGYPVLYVDAECGDKIEVLFSEDILPSGCLEPSHMHQQSFEVISDGTSRLVQPEFTWFGFRYFEVVGKAVPKCVKVVHANVPISSSFECDNETLNWIYDTFAHTMLCNMHAGIPSDCPHIERRGYTGDGQVTCHAALTVLDAKAFYEKWMQDIADCQDKLSGHVQYTAPFTWSGGGPGGWGCAVVEVPYQLYLHYGDRAILERYYSNMRRYIDYLEAHSEFGLVTSDKKGEWCLGDWCSPNILYPDKDITVDHQQMLIPAPFVNTYFMVRSLQRMAKIAQLIGKEDDVAEYEEKISYRKKAIQAAYFNMFDHNFMMNAHGANAYAVDIGLGDEKTYENMVAYYRKVGHFDTGIFATDIVTRVLFEHGDGELAVKLLANKGEQGFEHWRQNGATTFHEFWDSSRSRSHNHQMFGAPVAYFFEYLLGFKQKDGTAGYSTLSIEPQALMKFNRLSGSIKTPNGTLSARYTREDDMIRVSIDVPMNTYATFRFMDNDRVLTFGMNDFIINVK